LRKTSCGLSTNAEISPHGSSKYAARLKASSNIVVLKPEVAKAFPNAEAVNDALLDSSLSQRLLRAQFAAHRGRARRRRARLKRLAF